MRHVLSDHLQAFPGPRLLITHDPTEAFLLADEIALLVSGSVTQAGSADDIRLRPRSRYAADLVGSNLFVGHAGEGAVQVDGHVLHVADTAIHGAVLATIDPRAVAVHRHRPEGSPRNVWETAVDRVELRGDRVRIQLAGPLPIVAEVTPGAARELELEPGSVVWVSVKATEIGLEAG
jgi:molybdate transport system ATP-binding protein